MNKEIVLYSTGCPQCHVLETKLNNKEIKYDICSDKEQMLAMGFTTVPMLKVGEEYYNFSQAIKWIGEYTK